MICIIATKTTGLKQGSHEVIEVSIKPFGEEAVIFRSRPERMEIYEEVAQKMNGISVATAAGFPPKEQVAALILSHFKDITPIGHYFKFDYDMLRNTFGDKFIVELIGRNKVIDTAILSEEFNMKRLESGEMRLTTARGLDKICAAFAISEQTKVEKIEKLYRKLSA